MVSCDDCPAKIKCNKLCTKMEIYVNQDNNEEAWMRIKPKAYIEKYQKVIFPSLSTTEVILQNYFIDRMEIKEIAESHCKSRQYVHRVVKKYTGILIDNIKKSAKKV